jgi:Secretion system C-terminal sorting domain
MKKILVALSTLTIGLASANAQTTATDFTASDCASGSHNLFTELNNGKVVVLVWVMPCGTCISDAKAGYDAAQSFATSNPGQVLYWMADDAGNTTCGSLSSWASTNTIGPSGLTLFDNAGNTISEANYGGTGMPHVVVMGGVNHHIYYNQRNGSNDGAAITSAITQALVATKVPAVTGAKQELSLFPNPVKNKVSINYSLEFAGQISLEVYDIIGKKVQTVDAGLKNAGQHSIDVNFENKLPHGVYLLKLNTENGSQTMKFTVTE